MKSDHITALELAKFLETLKDSAVEKYRYFYNKDPNCKYTKKSLLIFQRQKDRILKELEQLAKSLVEV